MSKTYHHGDLRQALIAETLKLLKLKPAEQVSVADAARELGVSSGAPYRHFKDRDALLAEVAAIGFDSLRDRMNREMDPFDPGDIDRIVAGGCGYIFFSVENPELFHVMWGAARLKDAHEVAQKSGERCYRNFIENLARVMAAKGFDSREPTVFGTPLWTMVHGFASLVIAENRMLDRDPASIRRQVADATHAYFRGMA
ncbi:MAG: TetR/AcrR family transcriptional regulator [Pseudomonadota bacterium]